MGRTNGKKKIHLVNWEKVCKTKCKGGLGIKLDTYMNKAMVAKASWRSTRGDNGLWCKVYEAKYLQNKSLVAPS